MAHLHPSDTPAVRRVPVAEQMFDLITTASLDDHRRRGSAHPQTLYCCACGTKLATLHPENVLTVACPSCGQRYRMVVNSDSLPCLVGVLPDELAAARLHKQGLAIADLALPIEDPVPEGVIVATSIQMAVTLTGQPASYWQNQCRRQPARRHARKADPLDPNSPWVAMWVYPGELRPELAARPDRVAAIVAGERPLDTSAPACHTAKVSR